MVEWVACECGSALSGGLTSPRRGAEGPSRDWHFSQIAAQFDSPARSNPNQADFTIRLRFKIRALIACQSSATFINAGAFSFLIKPLDDDQFLRAVHGAFGYPIHEKEESQQQVHLGA